MLKGNIRTSTRTAAEDSHVLQSELFHQKQDVRPSVREFPVFQVSLQNRDYMKGLYRSDSGTEIWVCLKFKVNRFQSVDSVQKSKFIF